MTRVWYTCCVMAQPGVEKVTCGSRVSGCSGWSKISGSVDDSLQLVGRVAMYTTVITDTITMRATTITIRRTVLGLRPPNGGVGPTDALGGGWGELAKDASSVARKRGTRFNAWHPSCDVRGNVPCLGDQQRC